MAATPDDGSYTAELAGGSVLVITGQQLAAEDRRLLGAFVAQLRLAQEQQQLRQTADAAEALAAANELRAALLSAVSHDLRTPLASIKAAATSLLSTDVAWPAEVTRAFLEGIDADADRLTRLVSNLLDMSRLQTGALRVDPIPVSLDEVTYAALASLSRETAAVRVEVPETLAPVLADPALLERAVANLIANALTWSPPGRPVRVGAGAHALGVDLRVVDRGPGIPPSQRSEVFKPFQRLGDAHRSAPEGLGLGLPVARGFVEAMGGELLLEDTPGGGLTAVVTLPRAGGPTTGRPRPARARDAAPA